MTSTDIIKRSKEAFNSQERKNQETKWQDIAKYILLEDTGNFSAINSPGANKLLTIYSSKGARAARDLAATMMGTLTNPATKWVQGRFRDKTLLEDDLALTWLDQANSDVLSSLFDSSFYTEMAKFYTQLIALGNAALLVEDYRRDGKFIGINFKNLHLSELAWEEDAQGLVKRVYRNLRLTPEQIIAEFDEESIPEEVRLLAESGRNDKLLIIHCIKEDYKNTEEITSEYIFEKTGDILRSETYKEFPIFVGRWEQKIGEVYGFGPGHIALPEVKTLNRLRELYLEAEALRTKPPFLVNQQNILSPLALAPGKGTIVRDINGIREWQSVAQQSDSLTAMTEMELLIDKIFYLDKLMLPPRDQIGEMSAYETAQRIEQMQRVIGPIVSKLAHEVLTPLVLRVYKILFRNGKLPLLPPSLRNKNVDLDLIFLNQLARSQKMEDVSAIQGWSQSLLLWKDLNPSVLDVADFDEMAKIDARVRGVPETVIANEDVIKATREQRAQVQQQQMQADLMTKQADINAKNAKANNTIGQ